jgi:UDP-glucose 4-epimerase
MAKVLVTGGLGYIGSHTVVELLQSGYEVLIVDNLVNSDIRVLEGIQQITGLKPALEVEDLAHPEAVRQVMDRHPDIVGAIHFAAFKAVGESVADPLMYYRNNLYSMVNLLELFQQKGLQHFIFSSSCTVYGDSSAQPLTEDSPRKPAASPYGNTKIICEDILRDVCAIYPLQAISLRYFNPIGAHSSGHIGEVPNGVPQNLIPYLTQTALGQREYLRVWGSDYPTEDGTAVRDYIHVVDLAKAHVAALARLLQKANSETLETFNIGTGKGSSVLQVIHAFERATGVKVPYRLEARRPGDVVVAYADTTKAKQVLGWEATLSLEEALASAFAWEKKSLRSS